MKTIAIVGAGFCGTMIAVHLLRGGVRNARIVLIERSGRFTAGVAYGTAFSCHVLNVPTGRMSPFADDPDHFLRWARGCDATIHGGTFAPRMLYGRYLASLLEDAAANGPLERIAAEALEISTARNGQLMIQLKDQPTIEADAAALAIGNYPPADPPLEDLRFYESPRYARDPWSIEALSVNENDSVLLVGSGLTMLDVAMALRERGVRGGVYAISRRGLLPQPHRESTTPPPHHDRPKTIDEWPRTAVGLLRAVRAEVNAAAAHKVDWREVITSLRADTPALWKSLTLTERARFLRHLRPYWETHRHRAAPQIAAAVDQMIRSGQLRVLAGRLLSCNEKGDGVEVLIRRRSDPSPHTLRVGKVINCTGPDTDLARVRDPLIQRLREAGAIRPDALGLGLDTNDDGALIDSRGKVNPRMFLVGPLRKGQLWENTAVPELRIEAERMARRLMQCCA